mmetsp:Transcript_54598/g.145874  ORF Transcript_54598/g.145874 Transcript_54598/m.145874 type:complete len:619 (-) Transcript_54598:1388-3244(-)
MDVLRDGVHAPEPELSAEAQGEGVVGLGVVGLAGVVEDVRVVPHDLHHLHQDVPIPKIPVRIDRPRVDQPPAVLLPLVARLRPGQVRPGHHRIRIHDRDQDLERIQPLLFHQLAVDLPHGRVLVGVLPDGLPLGELVLGHDEPLDPVPGDGLHGRRGGVALRVSGLSRHHYNGPRVHVRLRRDALHSPLQHLHRLLVLHHHHHVGQRLPLPVLRRRRLHRPPQAVGVENQQARGHQQPHHHGAQHQVRGDGPHDLHHGGRAHPQQGEQGHGGGREEHWQEEGVVHPGFLHTDDGLGRGPPAGPPGAYRGHPHRRSEGALGSFAVGKYKPGVTIRSHRIRRPLPRSQRLTVILTSYQPPQTHHRHRTPHALHRHRRRQRRQSRRLPRGFLLRAQHQVHEPPRLKAPLPDPPEDLRGQDVLDEDHQGDVEEEHGDVAELRGDLRQGEQLQAPVHPGQDQDVKQVRVQGLTTDPRNTCGGSGENQEHQHQHGHHITADLGQAAGPKQAVLHPGHQRKALLRPAAAVPPVAIWQRRGKQCGRRENRPGQDEHGRDEGGLGEELLDLLERGDVPDGEVGQEPQGLVELEPPEVGLVEVVVAPEAAGAHHEDEGQGGVEVGPKQ